LIFRVHRPTFTRIQTHPECSNSFAIQRLGLSAQLAQKIDYVQRGVGSAELDHLLARLVANPSFVDPQKDRRHFELDQSWLNFVQPNAGDF
jgi:hypothetical protein